MLNRIFNIVLIFIFITISVNAEFKKSRSKKSSRPPKKPAISWIKPISKVEIKLPEEYKNGKFILDGDLLAFRAPDVKLYGRVQLDKYLVCDKQGNILREYKKVLLWQGSIMLKINELSSLLFVNIDNKLQKKIDIDLRTLGHINLNPFNKTIIYTYEYGNKVYEYDIMNRISQPLVQLDSGNLFMLSQLSPNEIIYIRPSIKIKYKNIYDVEPKVKIKIPLIMANLESLKWGVIANISPSGILLHFNEISQELIFVVEEKGYFKFISSKSMGKYKKVKVSQYINDTPQFYNGFLLEYSAINAKGNLLLSSKLKLKKKGKAQSKDILFYSIDPKLLVPESSDIYILDIEGNIKQITDTPDQIEIVNDWSPSEYEILYQDYKNKSFFLMELDLSDRFIKRPFETISDKIKKILP